MADLICVCGERFQAEEKVAALDAYLAHGRAAHAEFDGVPARPEAVARFEGAVRRAVERSANWDGQPRPLPGPLSVEPLERSRLGDWLTFFDRDGFVENPAWGSCYCRFYLFDGSNQEWAAMDDEDNRPAMVERIERDAVHGYLAYSGGRVVGWCHAAPKADLPGLKRSALAVRTGDDGTTGAIVCFVIAAPYRRQGVARALLDAACDGLRAAGMRTVEAYPREGTHSDAQAYHGPPSLFEAAGFERIAEENGALVLRRTLGPAS